MRVLFLPALLLLAPAFSGHAVEMPGHVFEFLDTHCLECHDDLVAESDLDLLSTGFEPTDPENFEVWAHVHDRIAKGEMPPPEKPRPTPTEIREVTSWLEKELVTVQQRRQDEVGRVQFRRLNRVEYENSLRDLLAIPGLEIKEMLPPDAEAHGFDNVGSALRISYVQMGRYLDASRKAIEDASWLAPEIRPFSFRLPFVEIRRFQITKDLTRIDGKAILLRQPNTAQTPWRLEGIELPFPGTHTIRIRARGVHYAKKDGVPAEEGTVDPATTPHVVSVYQGTRILGSFEIDGEWAEYELTGWIHPQEKLRLYIPTLGDWNPKWNNNSYEGPAVALDWVEFEGPAETNWPTDSYRALFGNLPIREWTEESGTRPPAELGEPKHPKRFPKLEFPHKRNRYEVVSEQPREDAKRLLLEMARKAFRHPVRDEEIVPYLDLVETQLDRNLPFHEAMIPGYVALFSSPDFLFFRENPGELDDHALATRLSFFLWKSPPDAELVQLADEGSLSDPKTLRNQVDRLLSDSKMDRFVEDFTDQWLTLREIRATQPDEKLYPEFDDYLLESMVRETRAYFREMVRSNLPSRSAVDSDFVFANNVLSDLYDLDRVPGSDLQRVALPAGSPRGGILTQASILKVTANGTTTSPVLRGAWTLDHLLGDPAPPPPPDIPAVEPDTRGTKSIREMLARHSEDASCAGCHAKMDPPGFALESLDAIGGWREAYRSLGKGEKVEKQVDHRPVAYRKGLPVDPSGQLADGREFSSIHEFRSLLLEDERQIARNLLNRLVVYGTGAGISFADRVVIEQILDETADSDYGVRDLIHAIVQSRLFQFK